MSRCCAQANAQGDHQINRGRCAFEHPLLGTTSNAKLCSSNRGAYIHCASARARLGQLDGAYEALDTGNFILRMNDGKRLVAPGIDDLSGAHE
jgi:hypothetical protein